MAVLDMVYTECGLHIFRQARSLFVMNERLAKQKCHLFFNHRCKDFKILPRSLRIQPPIPSPEGYELANRFGFKYLDLRIKENHQKIRKFSTIIGDLIGSLETECTQRLWRRVRRELDKQFQDVTHKTKLNHNQKLSALKEEQNVRDKHKADKSKWVVNLSTRSLTEHEISVLSKGMNFAQRPKVIPAKKIVAEVESAIYNLNEADKADVRNRVSGVLLNAKCPMINNIYKEEQKALRDLSKDESIIIVKADKGNSTVVMNRQLYDSKITDMLSDNNTYQKLKSDPSKSCTAKLKKLLLPKKEILPEMVYKKLNKTDGITPRLYGLPKIHKDGVPLRPIVSFIGSPTYELSKYLCNILAPLTGKSEYHIRNTNEWVTKAKLLRLKEDEELVSFDVVSLFTSIPTDLAIKVARERLENDPKLHERTCLNPDDICEMLDFCLNSTQFQFRNNYYKQIHGTAMGSPVSVVVANLVMEDIEQRAIKSFHTKLLVYARFVDDTISALKKAFIDEFHQHLNSQHPCIQFTVERYSSGGLPFLDSLNLVKPDGTIKITVYRKKTHTDRYLSFDSHHPVQHKAAVVRTLFNRALCLPSNSKGRREEILHVYDALSANGYPDYFLNKHRIDVLKQQKGKQQLQHHEQQQQQQQEKEQNGFATIPFIQGVSEKIKRILHKHSIKVALKPVHNIGNTICNIKDKISQDKQTGVIYSIPCADCNLKYIGETGRSFLTRKSEHQRSVRLMKTESSALAEHAISSDHRISWDDSKILVKESRWNQRKWEEAWEILSTDGAIANRDRGRTLPESYVPVVKKYS